MVDIDLLDCELVARRLLEGGLELTIYLNRAQDRIKVIINLLCPHT